MYKINCISFVPNKIAWLNGNTFDLKLFIIGFIVDINIFDTESSVMTTVEADFRVITDELHFKTIHFIVQITKQLYHLFMVSQVQESGLNNTAVKKYMQIRNRNPQSKRIFRHCLNVINMIPHILQPCASYVRQSERKRLL